MNCGRSGVCATLGVSFYSSIALEDFAMDALHPQYVIDENQTPRAVLLPVAEWEQVVEKLEELDDIRAFDLAKAGSQETIPFEQAVREIQEGSNELPTRSKFCEPRRDNWRKSPNKIVIASSPPFVRWPMLRGLMAARNYRDVRLGEFVLERTECSMKFTTTALCSSW